MDIHKERKIRSSFLSKEREIATPRLKIGFAAKQEVIIPPTVEDKDLPRVRAFLSSLSKEFVFSVIQDEPFRYKATFSIPTKEAPIPQAVAQIYVNIKEFGLLSFQLENRKFEYLSGGELDFDKAIESIIRNKIISREIGVDLKSDLVLQS